MSETTYLKLFKHDNPSTNTNQFDVDKALNDNWDKVDDFAVDVNEKIQEIEGNIAEQGQDIDYVKEELKTEINELQKDIQANSIIEETEQAKSLYIDDATDSRGNLTVIGNVEQETSETGVNKFNLGEDKQTQIGLEVTLDKSRVIINGTSTGSGYLWKYDDNKSTSLKFIGKFKAGTYKWFHVINSGNFSGDGAFALYIRNENGDSLATISSTNPSKTVRTITLEEDSNLYVNVFVNSANMIFNNLEILFQLQDNSVETIEYEEFIPNKPSVEYPSKINCLGNNKNELHMQETEYVRNGVTITQKESSLLLDGKTTSSANILAGTHVDIGSFKAGKYTFKIRTKGEFERPANTDFALSVREKTDTSVICANITALDLQNKKDSGTFELEEDKDLVIRFFTNAPDIIFSNYEMFLKIEPGETATSYSPYGQGSTEIKFVKKNLYNKENYIENITINTDGTIVEDSNFKIIKIPVIPNTTYTLSRSPVEGSSANIVYGITDKEPSVNISCTYNILYSTETEKQITTTEKTKYICIRGIKSDGDNPLFVNMQLEQKNSKTEFEEYQEEKIILDIQQEMLTGDYFDLDRKKEIHTWEKYEIAGNENWSIFGTGTDNYFYQFTIKDKLNKINEDIFPLSNYYKGASVATANAEKGIFVTINGTIRIREEKEETIEQFKAKLQELYNAGNPIEIWYKLAETIELDLTEAQIKALEQLNKLRFYKNVNNIFTLEDIALLQATYSVDLKSYINANKEN